MNKKRVDSWILTARDALTKTGIAENGSMKKAFRGQISSFGAAVVMGSLKSAVAFFSVKGEAEVDRQKLLLAMYYVINEGKVENFEKTEPRAVLEYVCSHDTKVTKELFVDASIALKLAMNFYHLD